MGILSFLLNPWGIILGFLLIFEEPWAMAILAIGLSIIGLITHYTSKICGQIFGWQNKWLVIALILFIFTVALLSAAIYFGNKACNEGPPDGFCFFAGLPFIAPASITGSLGILSSIVGVIYFFKKTTAKNLDEQIP